MSAPEKEKPHLRNSGGGAPKCAFSGCSRWHQRKGTYVSLRKDA